MTRGRQQQENHPRASDSRTAACIHPPATGCEPYAAEPPHGWNLRSFGSSLSFSWTSARPCRDRSSLCRRGRAVRVPGAAGGSRPRGAASPQSAARSPLARLVSPRRATPRLPLEAARAPGNLPLLPLDELHARHVPRFCCRGCALSSGCGARPATRVVQATYHTMGAARCPMWRARGNRRAVSDPAPALERQTISAFCRYPRASTRRLTWYRSDTA